jgi:hypothetical protein
MHIAVLVLLAVGATAAPPASLTTRDAPPRHPPPSSYEPGKMAMLFPPEEQPYRVKSGGPEPYWVLDNNGDLVENDDYDFDGCHHDGESAENDKGDDPGNDTPSCWTKFKIWIGWEKEAPPDEKVPGRYWVDFLHGFGEEWFWEPVGGSWLG